MGRLPAHEGRVTMHPLLTIFVRPVSPRCQCPSLLPRGLPPGCAPHTRSSKLVQVASAGTAGESLPVLAGGLGWPTCGAELGGAGAGRRRLLQHGIPVLSCAAGSVVRGNARRHPHGFGWRSIRVALLCAPLAGSRRSPAASRPRCWTSSPRPGQPRHIFSGRLSHMQP